MTTRQLSLHSLLLLLFVLIVPAFTASRLASALSPVADVDARVETTATGGIPVAVVIATATPARRLAPPVRPA